MLGHFELQPWNVIEGSAASSGYHLRFHRTAINVLPARPRIMDPNRLAAEEQRCSWFANLPDKLVGRINLALVNLCALGVKCRDDNFTVRNDRRRGLRDRWNDHRHGTGERDRQKKALQG